MHGPMNVNFMKCCVYTAEYFCQKNKCEVNLYQDQRDAQHEPICKTLSFLFYLFRFPSNIHADDCNYVITACSTVRIEKPTVPQNI